MIAVEAFPQNAKIDEAIRFLDEMRDCLKHKPIVFDQFKLLMREFKEQKISVTDLMTKMKDLLFDCPGVIEQFNLFISNDHDFIKVPPRVSPINECTLFPDSTPFMVPIAHSSGESFSQTSRASPLPLSCLLDFSQQSQPTVIVNCCSPNGAIAPQINQLSTVEQLIYAAEKAAGDMVATSPSNETKNKKQLFEPDREQRLRQFIFSLNDRFKDSDPDRFKSFLSILDAHEAAQLRCVHEMVTRLSALFTPSHKDLLLDFTWFLPEGVRQVAVDRIQSGEGLKVDKKERVGSLPSVSAFDQLPSNQSGSSFTSLSALEATVAAPISQSVPLIFQPYQHQQRQYVNNVSPRSNGSSGNKKRPRSSMSTSTQQVFTAPPTLTNPNQYQGHQSNTHPQSIPTTSSFHPHQYQFQFQQQQHQQVSGAPPIVSLLTAQSTPMISTSTSETLHHALPSIPRRGGEGGVVGTPEEEVRKIKAFDLVFRIRERLVGDPETYRAFLLILQAHRQNPLPLSILVSRVQSVLQNHSDLSKEFEAFLPEMRGYVGEKQK